MCLEVHKVNNELPVKIAEKDILCLKILECKSGRFDDDCYVTPYRGVQVPPEVLRGERDFLSERQEPGDYDSESYCDSLFRQCAEVSAGAIHTFACTEDSAQVIAGEISFLHRFIDSHITVVYLCVIPEGTEYMEGTFDEHKCYGSKALRFKRELLKCSSATQSEKIQQKLAPVIEEIICGNMFPADGANH